MSQRRILLVDNDRAFQTLLTEQLGPYGFEVVPASPADPEVLNKVQQLEPMMLVIAVDEPDKVGYSLCNKARKGVAASLPIILVTSSVAPQGFANHRKLKFHADEYIDKRGLTPHELVGKIDNLIGLPEIEQDLLQIPLEVDDVPLDLADAEVVEQLDEVEIDEGRTSLITPPAGGGASIEDDLDGAFAAITDFGEEPPPPAPAPVAARRPKEPTRPPPLPRNQPMPAPLPPVDVPLGLTDYVTDEPSLGVPEPIDPPHAELEAEEVPASEWSGEIPEPIEMGDFDGEEATSAGGPPLAEMMRMAEAKPVPAPMPEPEPVAEVLPEPEPEPEPELEPVVMQVSDADVEPEMISMSAIELPPEEPPAPAPAPEPEPEPAPAPVAAIAAPPPASDDSGIDLGLEEVEAKARDEQSGVHDRRTLQRIHVLERENAKLKTDVEKARTASGAATATQGREREFLHLREMIATKDKEILELRDELVVKDRQILDGKEKIRQLQHAKTQAEGKNLELEQRIVGDAERVEAADAVRKELEVQLADVTAKLAAVEAKTKADADAAARTIQERTAQATQLDKDLTAARAKLGHLEREHTETIASLTRGHDASDAELRDALTKAKDEALDALRVELGQAHASRIEGIEARHAEALAARDAEHTGAIEAAGAAHTAQLADLQKSHAGMLQTAASDAERTIETERKRAEDAIAAERAKAEAAIAEARAAADQAVFDAAEKLEVALAAEKASAEKALADANARSQEELAQVVTAQQRELDRLSGEHARALADAKAQADSQLAQTRAAAIAERDRLQSENAAAVAALSGDRDSVASELESAKAEIEKLGGELSSLADRARKDLGAAHDKARAEVEAATEKARRDVEAATAKAQRDVDAANEERDAKIAALAQEHEAALGALRGELHSQLAAEREATAARQRDVEAQAAAVAERDQRIAQLKTDLEALEQENAGYQEQVLKAYQKIKADESTVARAKKAMAIAMTLLDEEKAKAGGG